MLSSNAERVRLSYAAKSKLALDRFLLFANIHRGERPELIGEACTLVLQRKGLVLEAGAVQRNAAISGRYPGLKLKFEKLGELKEEMVHTTLLGPSSHDRKTHSHRLLQLRDEAEFLEEEIARSVPEMRLELSQRRVDWRAIAAALPEDTVLMEYVRCSDLAVPVGFLGDTREPTRGRYICFLIGLGKLHMVDLGSGSEIDELIHQYRQALVHREPLTSAVGNSRSLDLEDVKARKVLEEARSMEIAALLSERLWLPISSVLSEFNSIVIAPDGALSLLPFEAMAVGKGASLIDRCQISYLSCGRDFLRFERETIISSEAPLVIGDPDFDLTVDVGGDAQTDVAIEPVGIRRSDIVFRRLPGTLLESKCVARILSAEAVTGRDAVKKRVVDALSPPIIHLATHGFFFESDWPNATGYWSEREFGSLSELPIVENPMVRSGLVLAGANTWFRGGALPEEADNGLLTAEDISVLDLSKTELVVLSACDTGLGKIQVGEGILGLRRAFVLAGVKTLIMSLWKISDEATTLLMELFYKNLVSGQNARAALRAAQLELRDVYPDPQVWAAFICQTA